MTKQRRNKTQMKTDENNKQKPRHVNVVADDELLTVPKSSKQLPEFGLSGLSNVFAPSRVGLFALIPFIGLSCFSIFAHMSMAHVLKFTN